MCERCYEAAEAEAAKLQAEVERLRGDLQGIILERDQLLDIQKERDAENARLRAEQACIDHWLLRRQPVTHESATLRHVRDVVEQAKARLHEVESENIGLSARAIQAETRLREVERVVKEWPFHTGLRESVLAAAHSEEQK